MPDQSATHSTLMPAFRYRDAPAAIEWLCSVLGFTRHAVYANPDGTIAHAELSLGGGMIMLGSQKDDVHSGNFKSPNDLNGMATGGVYIVVTDADVVLARATEAGAEISRPIQNTDYGSREFALKDPEGFNWSVGTYDPWAARG